MSSRLDVGRAKGPFPSGFPTNVYKGRKFQLVSLSFRHCECDIIKFENVNCARPPHRGSCPTLSCISLQLMLVIIHYVTLLVCGCPDLSKNLDA
jgi:hypothetical protein